MDYRNLAYDKNGNMKNGGGREIQYTSTNMPRMIKGPQTTVAYDYGPDFSRLEKTETKGAVVEKTTYIDKLYEKIDENGRVKEKIYLENSYGVYAVVTRENNAERIDYFHKDHIGSTDVLSNVSVNAQSANTYSYEQQSFDPWGLRRNPDGTTPRSQVFAGATTTRGFTGHEHDDEIGLINMNARLYDPVIGRFITPDTELPDIENLQALNRYSYVDNNPLSFTDPTGHAPEFAFGCTDFRCGYFGLPDPLSVLAHRANNTAVINNPSNGDSTTNQQLGNDKNEALVYRSGDDVLVRTCETPSTCKTFTYEGYIQYRKMQEKKTDSASLADLTSLDEAAKLIKSGEVPAIIVGIGLGLSETVQVGKLGKLAGKAGSKLAELAKKATKSCCCFEKGTLVLTEHGEKPIELVTVGELVYSRNPATGKDELKPVTQLFINPNKEIYELRISNRQGAEEIFYVTDNHPFWVEGEGWVDSGKLLPGMEIAGHDVGPSTVIALRNLGYVEETYNFTVQDNHSYFVGENRVLVHNCGKCKTDRLKNHILNGELDAARKEAAGEVIARKANGIPWDHVDELKNAQRGLLKRITAINKQLGSNKLDDGTRASLLKELSEASKLLDKSEGYLPR